METTQALAHVESLLKIIQALERELMLGQMQLVEMRAQLHKYIYEHWSALNTASTNASETSCDSARGIKE